MRSGELSQFGLLFLSMLFRPRDCMHSSSTLERPKEPPRLYSRLELGLYSVWIRLWPEIYMRYEARNLHQRNINSLICVSFYLFPVHSWTALQQLQQWSEVWGRRQFQCSLPISVHCHSFLLAKGFFPQSTEALASVKSPLYCKLQDWILSCLLQTQQPGRQLQHRDFLIL